MTTPNFFEFIASRPDLMEQIRKDNADLKEQMKAYGISVDGTTHPECGVKVAS